MRVKLVDEFFLRFNRVEFRPDVSPKQRNAEYKNLLLLFDGSQFKTVEDSLFLEAQLFAQKVVDDSMQIQYRDSTWVAKAKCKGKLKGQDILFTLYLNVENRRDDLYKWTIAKASSEKFRLPPSLRKESIMLMPDDHETNFMSLRRITTEKDDYILNYSQNNFNIDETSVFYALVYNGLLNIDYVQDIEFIFFQVPGYKFTVKHFDREKYNSGWLISSLEKISDEEKARFLNYIYNK